MFLNALKDMLLPLDFININTNQMTLGVMTVIKCIENTCFVNLRRRKNFVFFFPLELIALQKVMSYKRSIWLSQALFS